MALWLIGVAVASAAFGLCLLAALSPAAERAESIFADRAEDVEFLFDGETMIDATPAARALLRYGALREGTPWQVLSSWLRARLPDALPAVEGIADGGRVSVAGLRPDGSTLALVGELRGGLTHLTLRQEGAPQAPGESPLLQHALHEELDRLRTCVATAPLPMWQQDAAGDVVWGNRAYIDLSIAALGSDHALSWPLPRLFDVAGPRRQSVTVAKPAGARWFDVLTPDGMHTFAVPADAAAQAEVSLRGFLQTLTRTFAHLPIGLAVFDGDRQLALFNPALTDLTGLPPDFLSARPSLTSFLDALRDRAMLPEPKNYVSWRRTLADLEKAASGGLFEETWSLPGGQTYRVTGRPHPNGGLAFLVEDISTEMTQTRRYRADLELGQAVIDAMDEAVAVFSPAGVMVMSNAAYAELWGHDPTSTVDGDTGIARVCEHWRALSVPTALWNRAEDYVAAAHGEAGWSDSTRLLDGRVLRCRFVHLTGGATLAAFRTAAGAAQGRSRPRAKAEDADTAPVAAATR